MISKVTLAITLPQIGTAFDYAEAICAAISGTQDMTAQQALSGLLSHIRLNTGAMPYVEGRSTMVFGKMS